MNKRVYEINIDDEYKKLGTLERMVAEFSKMLDENFPLIPQLSLQEELETAERSYNAAMSRELFGIARSMLRKVIRLRSKQIFKKHC